MTSCTIILDKDDINEKKAKNNDEKLLFISGSNWIVLVQQIYSLQYDNKAKTFLKSIL